MSEERLTAWLRNQVLTARAAGPVVRLDVLHVGPNGKYGNEVLSVDGIPEDPPQDWYGSIASQLIAGANADSLALSAGIQTYAICVYREKEPTKIKARFPYRANGGSDLEESDSILTEPPNRQGFLGQLMRHNEAQQKTLVAAIHTIMATTQRALSRLSDQNDRLQTQRMEQIELVEKLLSHQLERELEQKKAERRMQLMEDGARELKLLLPAVVNRISGKEIIPQTTDPKLVAMQRILGSLDAQQQQDILKTLRPEQQIALAELIQGISPTEESSP